MKKPKWIAGLSFGLALLLTVSGIATAAPKDAKTRQENGQYLVDLEDGAKDEAGKTVLTALTITGLEEPKAQVPFDQTALVTAEEGVSWEIPVFWVDSEGKQLQIPKEGTTCLPVFSFYVADGYTLSENAFLRLPGFLTEAFARCGGLICVFDPQSGITFITGKVTDPASLPLQVGQPSTSADKTAPPPFPGYETLDPGYDPESFTMITPPAPDWYDAPSQQGCDRPFTVPDWCRPTQAPARPTPAPEPELTPEELVTVFCSQTAIDNISQEQLAWFVNLIRNSVQPQATELLRKGFPAFRDASPEELGRQISLYVYYQNGDKDSPGHSDMQPGSLGTVPGSYRFYPEYAYMIGIDAGYYFRPDEDGNVVFIDSDLNRINLGNTFVHEMLHAFMFDYNRTGMTGIPAEWVLKDDTEIAYQIYERTQFPMWFIEGIASTVDNVFQFRLPSFQLLRYNMQTEQLDDAFTGDGVMDIYTRDAILFPNMEEPFQYQLIYADESEAVDQSTARYVTGYLAVLYLGELAARDSCIGSSVIRSEESVSFSSERIRLGLSQIIERMHDGETMDKVIRDISNGRFQNTAQFENEFIQGSDREGEEDSLNFCVDFLNYMNAVSIANTNYAHGSVLFPFDQDYTTPIAWEAEASSLFYQIVLNNDYLASTVTAENSGSGGTSLSGYPSALNSEMPEELKVSYEDTDAFEEQDDEDYLDMEYAIAAKAEEDSWDLYGESAYDPYAVYTWKEEEAYGWDEIAEASAGIEENVQDYGSPEEPVTYGARADEPAVG